MNDLSDAIVSLVAVMVIIAALVVALGYYQAEMMFPRM